MGCMQSTTDSNVSSRNQSSLMLYRLITERYNIQVQPPSLQNSSMIHRMHERSQCPSQMFVDMNMEKVFLNPTDDSQNSNSDTKSQEDRKHPRSHVISLKGKRLKKTQGPFSQIPNGY